MQPTIRAALPAALSAALVAGALAVPAIATTDDDPSDDTSTEDSTGGDATDDTTHDGSERAGRAGHGFGRLGLHGLEEGELAERLAAELGLDVGTVQDAVDAVTQDLAEERLAEAVEAGRLTQEQADRLAAAIADGTVEDVLAEIRLEQLEERLAERVEAGDITQEEADEILAAAEDGDWPGRDGHRRHGPGFGRGLGGPGFDDGTPEGGTSDDASSEDATLGTTST